MTGAQLTLSRTPWQIAWLAIRPRTLTISVAPVLVGTSLAWSTLQTFALMPFLAALTCAILIQIGTNLHNDAKDHESGNDREDRTGPLRVTSAGLLTPEAVKRAAMAAFIAAILPGAYLAAMGGWPILLIGLLSLTAGWSYSGGPRPIAYTPFGEGFVLLFFGILAVLGSALLQGLNPNVPVLLAGLICGFPAAAVLHVNNSRDVEADQRVGRRTLAITLSPAARVRCYALLMLLPIPAVLWLMMSGHPATVLALLPTVPTLRLLNRFAQAQQPAALAPLLPATAQLGFLQGILLSIGFWIS